MDGVLHEFVGKALVCAFLLWLLWKMLQPRYAFMVRIRRGRAKIRKGKVRQSFLNQLEDVCEEHRVAGGWVAGVWRHNHVELIFSRHFPPECRQQLRNEYFAPH